MAFINRSLAILSLIFIVTLPTHAAQTPAKKNQQAIYSQMALHHPVWAKQGMVAAQEALATQIGVDILQQGGNAVDAAVAVGYALAVTLPRAGNLGGGGFMLVYLDKQENVIKDLSRFHGLAIGTPVR